MSEKTIQDKQDQLLKAALKELESNRDILTGRTFRKWDRFPWFPFALNGLMLLVLLIFALFGSPIALRVQISFLLVIVFGVASAVLLTVNWAISNINKRIDKIVELTGAEKKLEEKYQSTIKLLAG